MRHLHRVLTPSAHVLLSFYVEYVFLTFSTIFMRVQVVRCPVHTFVAVWLQRTPSDHRRQFKALSGGPGQL